MEIGFSPRFRKQYRKADVRIRHRIDDLLRIFKSNPNDLQLNNHELEREWIGYRSIDVTADWRAIYEEKTEGGEIVAYFIELGTHEQLYKKNRMSLDS